LLPDIQAWISIPELEVHHHSHRLSGDLQKEFQWFAGILVIFLAIVTLIGTVDLSSSTYAIVVFGFTLIWVVRSAAIKYFSQ